MAVIQANNLGSCPVLPILANNCWAMQTCGETMQPSSASSAVLQLSLTSDFPVREEGGEKRVKILQGINK